MLLDSTVKFEEIFCEKSIKVKMPIAHERIRSIANNILDKILEMNINDFIVWMTELLYDINENEVNVAVNDIMLRVQVLSGFNLQNEAFMQSFKLLPQKENYHFNNHELILIGIKCYVFKCKNIASSLLYCISNRNLQTIINKCLQFLPSL